MKITYNEIIDVLQSEVITRCDKNTFKGVETDTRRLGEDFIFFALKGERVNGNDLVGSAVDNGALMCVVDEYREEFEEFQDEIHIIKVEDSRRALCDLATYYRGKFDIKVVGITGSTGKTSTKDILSGMLSEKYNVFKTLGNFNSDVGLPLMIFKFKEEHDVAVLEMGMSGLGEIELLVNIAKPHIGMITNIGDSHLEQLKTRDNILKAKMEITSCFNEEELLIINNNDDKLKDVNNEKYRILRCGIENYCDINTKVIKGGIESVEFETLSGEYSGESFIIPMPGKHNVLNAALCLGVCQELKMEAEDIRKGLRKISKTSMRLDMIKNEDGGFMVINDCYNASPDSMMAAIDILAQIEGKKILVLGTMRELGDDSYLLHEKIGEYAGTKGVNKIYATGEFSQGYIDGFNGDDKILYKDKKELVASLKKDVEKGDVILIKASRSMRFETITEELLKN